jgi:hypothetical protein
MRRKSALATAAALAATLVAASAATALNGAILASEPDGGVGSVTPVDETIANNESPVTIPAAAGVRVAGDDAVSSSSDSDDRVGDDSYDAYEDENSGQHEDDDAESGNDEDDEYEGYEHDD